MVDLHFAFLKCVATELVFMTYLCEHEGSVISLVVRLFSCLLCMLSTFSLIDSIPPVMSVMSFTFSRDILDVVYACKE